MNNLFYSLLILIMSNALINHIDNHLSYNFYFIFAKLYHTFMNIYFHKYCAKGEESHFVVNKILKYIILKLLN